MTTPNDQLLDLTGRTAIVTGGAMGIGLGIARRLAEAGAAVVIADLDAGAGALAAKGIVASGWRATAVVVDVADPESVRGVIDATVERHGGLDVLVNNAGVYPARSIAELQPAEFDRILAVNLRGVFLGTKYAADAMRRLGRGGSIVNVTSIDAVHPSLVGLAAYDASKHGVWGLTKNAALELAPLGIRVNAVAPGGIATPGVARLAPGDAGHDAAAEFLSRIPMGRMGVPDEIGTVVLFLVSPMAAYMTGSQVVVDGGALLA